MSVSVVVLLETVVVYGGGREKESESPLLPGLLPVRVMVVVPVRVWPSESVDGKKETMSVSVVVLLETVVVYGGGSEKESESPLLPGLLPVRVIVKIKQNS